MPATPAGSSANESSTSDHENSSAATDNAQPNEATTNSTTNTETTGTATDTTNQPTTPSETQTPSPNSTGSSRKPEASATGPGLRAEKLDIEALTPKDQAVLELIGLPLSGGWKENELAAQLGRPQSWVSEQLADLRTAIGLQQGIFPPLTDAERAALKDSIAEYGVLEPVHVNHNTNSDSLEVFDGRNRIAIARELVNEGTIDDMESIRYLTYENLTPVEMSALEFTLNASRRQLDRKQKRKLVEHQLHLNAERSDRMLGAICGVDHVTVGNIRKDLAAQWLEWNKPPEDDEPETEITIPELEPATAALGLPDDVHQILPLAKPAEQTTVNAPQRVTPFTPERRTTSAGISRIAVTERVTPQPATNAERLSRQAPEREWTIGPITCPTCKTKHTLIRVGEKHILRT